jgi:hypothetical protein
MPQPIIFVSTAAGEILLRLLSKLKLNMKINVRAFLCKGKKICKATQILSA